ncbi:hypothetical protein Gotur_028885, partial [Gossypium turneri]
MDVLQRQTVADNTESVNILNSNPLTFQKLLKFKLLTDEIKDMTDEKVGVLLIVFTLVLTMTYQGILSPPDSIFQGDATATTSSNHRAGKSVMKAFFLLFYIPNGAAFFAASIMTVLLLESVTESITHFFFQTYIMVWICYVVALSTIAPSSTL